MAAAAETCCSAAQSPTTPFLSKKNAPKMTDEHIVCSLSCLDHSDLQKHLPVQLKLSTDMSKAHLAASCTQNINAHGDSWSPKLSFACAILSPMLMFGMSSGPCTFHLLLAHPLLDLVAGFKKRLSWQACAAPWQLLQLVSYMYMRIYLYHCAVCLRPRSDISDRFR